MILTKLVKFKTHTKLKQYYKDLGYDMSGEFVEINIKNLKPSSHIKILVECDVCGYEKELPYSKYQKNISNGNYYSCSSKCSIKKSKTTSLIKYGFDNPNKPQIIKDKTTNNNFKKYGVKYPTQLQKIKDKIIKLI